MKEEEKKEDKPYISLEDIIQGEENKYKAIVKIAQEINQRMELSPERDDTLIYKVLKELESKKSEKDSAGSNG